jgi:hypothetical protein
MMNEGAVIFIGIYKIKEFHELGNSSVKGKALDIFSDRFDRLVEFTIYLSTCLPVCLSSSRLDDRLTD